MIRTTSQILLSNRSTFQEPEEIGQVVVELDHFQELTNLSQRAIQWFAAAETIAAGGKVAILLARGRSRDGRVVLGAQFGKMVKGAI